MGLGIWEAGLLLAIALALFGMGKLPTVMGDLAQGLKRFKREMATDSEPTAPPPTPDPATPAVTHRPLLDPPAEPAKPEAGRS